MENFKCGRCKKEFAEEVFAENFKVCPNCNMHYILSASERIQMLADEGSFHEIGSEIRSADFLNFVDIKPYSARIAEAEKKSLISEAVLVGSAKINDYEVSLGAMDFSFLGGSMGSVVGERIKLLCENAISNRSPLIIVATSGGARMQEGIVSLMQMAKTVSAINRVKEQGIPYFAVIANPTTGGASASFATVADIIIAEPEALFCFAGPRVVKQTIKKEIPADFGLSERNLKNGQVDMITDRKYIKEMLSSLLKLFCRNISAAGNSYEG